jgi:hypothetical protein
MFPITSHIVTIIYKIVNSCEDFLNFYVVKHALFCYNMNQLDESGRKAKRKAERSLRRTARLQLNPTATKDSTMSLPASKSTRNADLRHAQSLGRQRKNTVSDPRSRAEAIYRIIQKRVADGQPLPDLARYGVTDDIWAELIFLLSGPELEAVKAAYEGEDEDDDEPSADDWNATFVGMDSERGAADIPPVDVAPPKPYVASDHTPSWRDHEPAIVHSLKWKDTDGIEHLHVVRADTLDEALLHIRKVKVVIAAAKAKTQQEPKENHAYSDSRPDWCTIHNTQMTERSNAHGKWYSHALSAGGFCKGK